VKSFCEGFFIIILTVFEWFSFVVVQFLGESEKKKFESQSPKFDCC